MEDVPYVVRVKKRGVVIVENGPWTKEEAEGLRLHFLSILPSHTIPQVRFFGMDPVFYDEIVVDPFQPTLF